jgi:hypothetical protein
MTINKINCITNKISRLTNTLSNKKIIRDYYIERASKSAYELEKKEHWNTMMCATVSSVVDCAWEKARGKY